MSERNYLSADSLRRTFIFIEINGETFDWFEQYTVTSDLLVVPGQFTLTAPALPRDNEDDRPIDLDARGFRRGQRVKVYVKTPEAKQPVLVMTGIIDEVHITETRDGGASVTVTGRDHMAPIVDCDILPTVGIERSTLAQVGRKLLCETMPGQPKAFFRESDLVIDNDANRVILTGKPPSSGGVEKFLMSEAATIAATTKKATAKKVARAVERTIEEVKPHAGETIFGFLQRHAQRFGLLIWGSADGKVVFGRPNYEQSPLYTLRMRQGANGYANNVIAFSRRTSFKHRPSETHVYGKGASGDQMPTEVHAVVFDDEVHDHGLYRVLTVHDQGARTRDEAERKAQYEMSHRRQSGDVIHAVLEGHAEAQGVCYAIDTIAAIKWDKAGIDDSRYVVSRTFTASRHEGQRTTLDIVPKDSIALGDGDE